MSRKKELSQIERQLSILRRIPVYPQKVTVNDLLDYLKVSHNLDALQKRSVQRDMNTLENIFGISVEAVGKEHYYYFQQDTNVSLKMMGPDMALGFLLMEKYATSLLPEQTLDRLNPYFKEAKEVLNSQKYKYVDWGKRVAVYPNVYPLIPAKIDANLLLDIYKALLTSVKCTMTYKKKSGEINEYCVSAQGVIHKEQVSYLIATYGSQQLDKPRTFAIHRIVNLELLEEPSEKIPDFSIGEYTDNGQIGLKLCEDNKVVLLFNKNAALHLEETPISTDQKITPLDDERVKVEATLTIKDSVKWWLLGFGHQVEVIKPKELRQEMAQTVGKMYDSYLLKSR
ncbi:MAG: WYL domain-containing protein [Rickettsiales bacterium]|jgi:predicted DNA-binding transcriptional regulator YafY|nr:WYL domain-containing protein [Rickettsiales bacterium]